MFTRTRRDIGITCGGVDKVQRHLKKFTDVNYMVSRALQGDTTVFKRGGFYGDLSNAPDSLQSALNLQIQARNSYNALPEAVRKAYPTPEAFLAASSNPDEVKRLRELGCIEPEKKNEPVKVEVVTAPKGSEPSNVPSAKNT